MLERVSKGIRGAAWALVAVGVAAPILRRRVKLPPGAVLGAAAAAPVALLRGATAERRPRDRGVCALNMWAYVAAYELPHDDPERLEQRVHVRYPIIADRVLGLGVPPTLRLQRLSSPGSINRVERVLVWSHWLWFFVPHTSVLYVLIRVGPSDSGDAAARMYAVFDTGAVFYWAIPTAPPWWAAAHGHFGDGETAKVRRMMIEYGEQFWEDRWEALYDVLGGNPLAAMPSLHFATSLMAAHLLSEVGPAAGAVGWAYTSGCSASRSCISASTTRSICSRAPRPDRDGPSSMAPQVTPTARLLSAGVRAIEARAGAG